MTRPAKLHWLVSCCSVLLAGLLFSATLNPGSTSSPAYYVVNLALFISLVCYLLLPAASNLTSTFINSSVAIVLFIFLFQMPFRAGMPVTILLQVCVVIFCLGMLLWSLTQLFENIFPGNKSIRIAIILLTTIITSTPVWLGPVVDIYQLNTVVINSVVSITPLTHFSVAAEYDYLRSAWMYQNSAFGSLPFAYPDFNSITVFYFLFVFTIRIILWGLIRHPQILKSLHGPRKNFN